MPASWSASALLLVCAAATPLHGAQAAANGTALADMLADDGGSRGALGSRDPFRAFRQGDMDVNELMQLCKELRNTTAYEADKALRDNVEETCPTGGGLSMLQMNLISLAGVAGNLLLLLTCRLCYQSRVGVHRLERFALNRQTEDALAVLRSAQDALQTKSTGSAVWHAPSFRRRQLAETPVVRTRRGDEGEPRPKADEGEGDGDGDGEGGGAGASFVRGHSAQNLPDTDVLVRTLCLASATDNEAIASAVLALEYRALALSIERATPPPPSAVATARNRREQPRHTPSTPLNVACGTGSALVLDCLLRHTRHDTTRDAARLLADAMLACARGTPPLVVLMGRIGSQVRLPEAPVAARAACLERLFAERRAAEALESLRGAEREEVFRLREAGMREAAAAASAARGGADGGGALLVVVGP